jgi:hypothetical protein
VLSILGLTIPRSLKKERSKHLADEIALLPQLTTGQLQARYAAVFGEPTRVAHKAWLIKRIAWRLQALAEGDLSQRARQRALELANDADLRLWAPGARRAPAPPTGARSEAPDPSPGQVLTRLYKGERLKVTVLEGGFAYAGTVYRSLSAVAKAITGSHCNGLAFFGLKRKEDSR